MITLATVLGALAMEERKLIAFSLALSRPQTDVAKEIGSMVGVQGWGGLCRKPFGESEYWG